MGLHSSKLPARCGGNFIVYEGLVRIRSFVYAEPRWLVRLDFRPSPEVHSSLLREVNVTVDGVLVCVGVLVLLALKLGADRRDPALGHGPRVANGPID